MADYDFPVITEDGEHGVSGTLVTFLNVQRLPALVEFPNELLILITENLEQADIKSLVLTCVRFNIDLKPILLQRDIRDATYNSLAWACVYGDVGLAQAALEVGGADPTVTFCHDQPQWENWQRDHGEYRSLTSPIFPTKRHKRSSLIRLDEAPCCALYLATARDHVHIIKLLLTWVPRPSESRTRKGSGLLSQYQAPVVSLCMGRVRSFSAAKVFLENGPEDLTNDYTNWLYESLSAILELYLPSEPSIGEVELHKIVELFLRHGAMSPRKVLGRWETNFGVLSSAAATECCSIIRLIAAHGIAQQTISDEELDDFLFDILGSYGLFPRDQMLVALLEAGVSPNRVFYDEGPLLWAAIKNVRYDLIRVLFEWKADTKGRGDWASLSLLLFQSRMHVYDKANRFDDEEAQMADH